MIHSYGSRLHLETTPTNFIPAEDSIPCCNGGTSAGLEPFNVQSAQSLSGACRFTAPLVAALDMVDQYQTSLRSPQCGGSPFWRVPG